MKANERNDMTEKDISSEEFRGRTQEIQQIVAHRFHLTTFAIVIFSAISGWLTVFLSRLPSVPTADMYKALSVVLPSVSILQIAIFGLLYYEYFALLRVLRIFSTYMLVKYPAGWEGDWEAYRLDPLTKKYSGYSKSGFRIFLFVSLLSLLYPTVFLYSFRDHLYWATTWPLVIMAGVLFLAFVVVLILTTYRPSSFLNEGQLRAGWMRILEIRTPPADEGPSK